MAVGITAICVVVEVEGQGWLASSLFMVVVPVEAVRVTVVVEAERLVVVVRAERVVALGVTAVGGRVVVVDVVRVVVVVEAESGGGQHNCCSWLC